MLDKHLISLLVAGTLLFILIAGGVILLVLNFRKRKNDHFIEKRRLLIANLEEGERMMGQIAKEVHDNIGQLSHLLYMTLDKIEKTPGKEDQIKLLCQARQITDTIIFNADNVSHSLNSDYIKKRGLSNIIQDDVEHIRSLGKIECRINFDGTVKPFHPDKELLIYRIAQEAMHNTLKHSEASLLDILLCYKDHRFKMKIKDDGIGFETGHAIKKGIGLSNMHERANLLRGKLEIVSEPGDGCSVTLSIDNNG